MRLASAVLAFWSAFLLFIIQPAAGKHLLASFGGTPAVWTSVLVFFQLAVVGGYALAMGLARWQSPLMAALAVVALAGFGWITHPSAPLAAETSPSSGWPAWTILAGLSVEMGCAVVAVATTSTLLQEWLGRRGGDPAWLYAASNAGSLGGLTAYVLLVEPTLALETQGRWWQWGVASWGGMMMITSLFFLRNCIQKPASIPVKLRIEKILVWMLMGAVPCFFLMAATRHLVTDVAPVPLLGLSPLALYLVAYTLAFGRGDQRLPSLLQPIAGLALLLMAGMGATDSRLGGTAPVVILHLAGFFLVSWGALAGQAASRPEPALLPAFYLATAVGGALGGTAQSTLAPVVFRWLGDWDYALGLAVLMLATPSGWRWPGWRDAAIACGLGLATWCLTTACPFSPGPWRELTVRGAPLAVAFALAGRSAAWGPCLAAIFIVGAMAPSGTGRTRYLERGFFGTTRVVEEGPEGGALLKLYHGTTVHGVAGPSLADEEGRALPLAYYHPKGPAGATLGRVFPPGGPPARVAVIGLGAGSLAWYARAGDEWDFFEIDPVVIRAATMPGLFPYLRECRGRWRIIQGDGRLGLEMDGGPGYDAIIIDAFSSDSIPAHLLTVEALTSYKDKLTSSGILLMHISNRYLELAPVAARSAAEAGLAGWEWADLAPETTGTSLGRLPSEWVALRHNPDWEATRRGGWSRLRAPAGTLAWTDQHSSVLSAWRKRDAD